MKDCLFCKIVAGEIPASKVYEDAEYLAFLDIHPVSTGHTLVVPKTHSENIEDTSEEVFAELMKRVKKMGKKGMMRQGFRGLLQK